MTNGGRGASSFLGECISGVLSGVGTSTAISEYPPYIIFYSILFPTFRCQHTGSSVLWRCASHQGDGVIQSQSHLAQHPGSFDDNRHRTGFYPPRSVVHHGNLGRLEFWNTDLGSEGDRGYRLLRHLEFRLPWLGWRRWRVFLLARAGATTIFRFKID